MFLSSEKEKSRNAEKAKNGSGCLKRNLSELLGAHATYISSSNVTNTYSVT